MHIFSTDIRATTEKNCCMYNFVALSFGGTSILLCERAMITTSPLSLIMRKKAHVPIAKYRKDLHLKLKDLAFILNIDSGNLSRFEAGDPNSF